MHDYDRTKVAYLGNYRESMDSFYGGLTTRAMNALDDLDEKFIGTPDYMGLAYFWSNAYKFSLREATTAKRREVHDAFRKAGLKPDGVSPEHEAIVKAIVGL
jgi:hypothetical protein